MKPIRWFIWGAILGASLWYTTPYRSYGASRPDQSGLYLSLGTGFSFTREELSSCVYCGTTDASSLEVKGLWTRSIYAAALGYKINAIIPFRLEMSYSKNYPELSAYSQQFTFQSSNSYFGGSGGGVGTPLSYSYTRSMVQTDDNIFTNFYWDIARFDSWRPYIGFGIGIHRVNWQGVFSVLNLTSGDYQVQTFSGSVITPAYNGTLGLNYEWSSHWAIGAAYSDYIYPSIKTPDLTQAQNIQAIIFNLTYSF